MKKVLSLALVLAMVLALAVPALAANVKIAGEKDGAILCSEANEWTVSVPAAGTVTVKDNKAAYEFDFDAVGTYSLGLQKVYTGQLSLVGFEPYFYVAFMDADNVYMWWTAVKWNDEVPFPDDPVKDGFIFRGWKTQWSDEIITAGLTYAELVGGNNTVTSESLWAVWEAEITEEKTKEEWIADITKAINDAIAEAGKENILDLIVSSQGSTTITLTIDGEVYVFTGGGGMNSDKVAVIDGVRYVISIQSRGNPPTITWQVG